MSQALSNYSPLDNQPLATSCPSFVYTLNVAVEHPLSERLFIGAR